MMATVSKPIDNRYGHPVRFHYDGKWHNGLFLGVPLGEPEGVGLITFDPDAMADGKIAAMYVLPDIELIKFLDPVIDGQPPEKIELRDGSVFVDGRNLSKAVLDAVNTVMYMQMESGLRFESPHIFIDLNMKSDMNKGHTEIAQILIHNVLKQFGVLSITAVNFEFLSFSTSPR